MSRATIHRITRHNGVAGQYAYEAHVQYPGEDTQMVTFVGSEYDAPIVVAWGGTKYTQAFVTDPGRFGSKLTPEWVRRFFE